MMPEFENEIFIDVVNWRTGNVILVSANVLYKPLLVADSASESNR